MNLYSYITKLCLSVQASLAEESNIGHIMEMRRGRCVDRLAEGIPRVISGGFIYAEGRFYGTERGSELGQPWC